MHTYWTFQDDMAVIDGVIHKGGYVIIPKSFEKKTGIKSTSPKPHGNRKTKFLAHESICSMNIKDDIEKAHKNCFTCLNFQQT